MFIVIFILYVPAVALPLTVERMDNGSIIVSQSVVVSRGKATNISSSVVIRNNKKKTAYPNAGNASVVSTRRKGCTADIRANFTEFMKTAPVGATAETGVGSRNGVLTKTLGAQNKYARKSTEPFETTVESFLNAFKQKTPLVISKSTNLHNKTNGTNKTWLTTSELLRTSRPGFAAGIARLFWKISTSKASKRPITAPLLAADMLRDSFQIDYGWVHQKRVRRHASDYDAVKVNNMTVKPDVSHLDNDTRMVLVLLIALLLLALSSIMSYRPSVEHPYCIRLRPGAPVFYQPLPTSDCLDAVNTRKSNLKPRDKRFTSLVRTKILVSQMVRRYRGRSEKQSQIFDSEPTKDPLPSDSVSTPGHPSARPEGGESGVEPYIANFVLKDVPQEIRKLLLKVQLQQRSDLGTVRTYHKEINFDLSS